MDCKKSNYSSMFEHAVCDPKGLEKKILGPTYPYGKNIRTPGEMGMSAGGSLSTLAKDVKGIINYTSLLVEGWGPASSTYRPLGNKFFLKTGGKCKDITQSGKPKVDRYVYINNIPQGYIPILTEATGKNFNDFRGLAPGILTNMANLNPVSLLGSFMAGSEPDCRPLTMQVVDNNNNRSEETKHVTIADIKNMDPCSFGGDSNEGKNTVNPETGERCNLTRMGFSNLDENNFQLDNLDNIYIFSLSGLLMYILYRYMNKI